MELFLGSNDTSTQIKWINQHIPPCVGCNQGLMIRRNVDGEKSQPRQLPKTSVAHKNAPNTTKGLKMVYKSNRRGILRTEQNSGIHTYGQRIGELAKKKNY